MTDRDDAGDRPPDPPGPAAPGPPPAEPGDADRRAFLRRLPGTALRTAEQVAGISLIMRRTVVAVGETLIRDVEPQPRDGAPAGAAATAALVATTPETAVAAAPEITTPPGAGPPASAVRDPIPDLTAEQHAFLREGTSLVIAANDPAGAPHLTSSPYAWDGTIFSVPGRLSSARAIAIDRDPRVSLLIHRAGSEAWVAVTGLATLGPIDDVESEMRGILAASLEPQTAAARWQEMAALGDAIVIHIRPTRFVWRTS